MTPIELAERRYHDLFPPDIVGTAMTNRYRRLPEAMLEAWLADYVVPAITEILDRPLFREYATWSLRTLTRDAASPERQAVERVAAALKQEARALLKLSDKRLIRKHLDEMTAAGTPPKWKPVVITGKDLPPAKPWTKEHTWYFIPDYLNQLARIRAGAWTDLVSAKDFFLPVSGMMYREPLPAGASDAATIVSLQPRLFFVGDSIVRCMLQRVRDWLFALEIPRKVIYEARRRSGRAYPKPFEAESATWTELRRAQAGLETACSSGYEARLRDACVTAVYVYAEYHSTPSLDWLGLAPTIIETAQGRLRHNITNTRELETIERIAAALTALKDLYRDEDPALSSIEAAIAAGGLVLVDRTGKREAHWNKQRIQADWLKHKKPWEMLLTLAQDAPQGRAVADRDLYDDAVSNSTMANRWKRLKELIPATLSKRVTPGAQGPKSYLLDLPSHLVHIF